jgi:putative oxidoreductase
MVSHIRRSSAGQADGQLSTLWKTPVMSNVAVLIARLIFGGVFAMAACFKFIGMGATADFISAAGIPFALPFAWIAAFFECALALALWTGLFFSEAAFAAAAYVLFLAFTFHGPSHWKANQAEFGFFVDHFTFIAGLLFAAVHGPGGILTIRRSPHPEKE